MIRVILVLCVVFLAVPVRADVPERLEAAFRLWVQEVGAENAAMAILHKGRPQRDVAIGQSADTVIETASLSKAITATCAAHLIEQGIWRAETTSAEVLGTGARGITLGQLLTHTSGLGPDQTQGWMQLWLDRKGSRTQKAARRALGRAAQTGTVGSYRYNNENYAVIGAMIAQQTGESYESYCLPRVLAPSGARRAARSVRAGRFLPWGGWQMTVGDYAAFHWHAFGPDGIIGRDPDRWPSADLGGGARYGMGMFQRAMQGTHNHWHFGALCFPVRMNIGSYAVIWREGYSVAVAYDVCPSWDQMSALDAALVRAVFP